MNIRLLQRFTLRSPLSHIGETISTIAYLVEEPILQPDGTIEKVFCYSGNAWRGQLRDLMASYLLDQVGSPRIGLDAFHLLYSGGAIGGPQQTNLQQSRAYRQAITPIALLGGGIGNQVLPGKLRFSNVYPLCREAPSPLGFDDPERRERISYRDLTTEKSFSRKDDSKDTRLNGSLALPDPEQTALALDDAKPKRKSPEEPAQQMRMTVELLIPGVQLLGHIDALDVTEVELGCLVAAMHRFSRSPHIGGQANRGHGLVALETVLVDLDTRDVVSPFVTVVDYPVLSPRAADAKQAYDAHLKSLYDAMLSERETEIRALIGAVA